MHSDGTHRLGSTSVGQGSSSNAPNSSSSQGCHQKAQRQQMQPGMQEVQDGIWEMLSLRRELKCLFKSQGSQVLVAHTCNPRYSGGRDQEDCSSKPTQANSSRDPILKKANTKQI
jgi:hypothetical protein